MYYHKYTEVSMGSTLYSCQISTKPDFLDKISKKNYSNTKFHENPSGGIQVVSCGREDTNTSAGTDDGREDGQADRERERETDMTYIIATFRKLYEHV
jgi:hypothetical protein